LARGVRDWGWDGSGEWGGEDHGSGEESEPRTWGERGGGEWKAKLFIQPAAAEGGRRCMKGSGGLQSKAEGARHVHWWRVGKSTAQRRGATGADGLQTVRLSRNSPRVRQRAGQLRAWHSANAA
jgi:hypothetical protein